MPRATKKYHYLYKTTNLITGKFYVGMHSTDNLEDGYMGSGQYITRSIKRHGKENYIVEKLKFFDDRKALVYAEEQFVNATFINDPQCMNLQTGGIGRSPYKMSVEHKNKISNAHKGKTKSIETRRRMSTATKGRRRNIGIKFSDERKKNISLGKDRHSVLCTNNNTTYPSISAASKALKIPAGNIGSVCKGNREHTCGYRFVYSE